MKALTVILSVMVTLSLAFSIAAFAYVTQNNGNYTPSAPTPTQTPTPTYHVTTPPAMNYPTQQPTQNPTPTTKPSPTTQIRLSFQDSRQDLAGGVTRVVYRVTATYCSGQDISINYSDFKLDTYTPRSGFNFFNRGRQTPDNSGTVTLSSSNPTEIIQLTFQFPTTGFNGMDTVTTASELGYYGPAAVTYS